MTTEHTRGIVPPDMSSRMVAGLGIVVLTLLARPATAEETAAPASGDGGVASPVASAESPTPVASPAPTGQPSVGLVAAAGLHTGLAAGVRAGTEDVGIEVLGGYQLLFAEWTRDSDFGIAAASSAQIEPEIYLTPIHPRKTSSLGLKGGYRYNSILHHGFAAGIAFLFHANPHLAVEVSAGASVFPGRADALRAAVGVPGDASVVYGSQAQIFEYGLELVWYP